MKYLLLTFILIVGLLLVATRNADCTPIVLSEDFSFEKKAFSVHKLEDDKYIVCYTVNRPMNNIECEIIE